MKPALAALALALVSCRTLPETDQLDRAVAIALIASEDARLTGGEYHVIGARRFFHEGKFIWRVTFKPRHGARMMAGGEIFVNVDLETAATTIRYGE